MKTKKIFRALCILGLLSLTGCATILQQGPDHITVNSNPSGAKVFLDGQPIGTTPMVAVVNRSSEGIFRLEANGYEPVTLDRDKVVSGWVFGNILLGGLIGLGVDLATHNQGHYAEEPIYMNLQSKQGTALSSQNFADPPRDPASK